MSDTTSDPIALKIEVPPWMKVQPPDRSLKHPQDAMFVSCYRCGAGWRAAGGDGITTALRRCRAFVREHTRCPRPPGGDV